MAHPVYELPKTPHAEYRYKMAMEHVDAAKKAGKSSEEIHEIFKSCMDYDIHDLPQDEAHAKYRSALLHAEAAMKNGKPAEYAHKLFEKIMFGKTAGKCGHHEKL